MLRIKLRRETEVRFYRITLCAATEYRGIAQLVEQRSPKPRVQSSSLCAPAKYKRDIRRMSLLYFVDERDTRTLIKYSPQADISVAARLRNPKSLPKLCVRRERAGMNLEKRGSAIGAVAPLRVRKIPGHHRMSLLLCRGGSVREFVLK